MSESWEDKLVSGLIDAGEKNGKLTEEGDVKTAMKNIADPIIEAIKNGESFIIVGSATCDEIKLMENMQNGDVWAVKDSGVIKNADGSILSLSPGDLIRYNGEKWEMFLHLDLSGYATTEALDKAITVVNTTIASVRSSLSSHIEDKGNPHNVTAEQVGTYTKGEIDAKIAEAMSSSGRFLGSLKPSELNELIAGALTRMSDYAVMSEDGTVEWDGGSVQVVSSDEVVQTESGAWVIKPSASFGISVTGEMFKVVKF